MTCLICGEICRCSTVDSATTSRGLADDGACPAPAPLPETPGQQASVSAEAVSDDSPPEDSAAWRQEVAARLNRYQARHKPRPPRYPSLRLGFEGKDPARPGIVSTGTSFSQTSRHALALNDFEFATEEQGRNVREHHSPDAGLPRETGGASHAAESSQANASVAPPAIAPTAKIIEFPRFWTPAPAPLDELAEPVMDRPRILEAPELLPPPPALGGIIIEPAPQPETEKRPGIDIPLQSAPLARRIFSAAIDDAIVAAACVLFGYVFFKMTLFRPARLQIMIFAGGLFGLFWAVYQYLLLVHSGSTPGLRLARLELARFDGRPARRSLRRWRVLASFLSAISLGMGYAWVFLDEDALCWHDRITHTYLAPKTPFAETEPSPTRG